VFTLVNAWSGGFFYGWHEKLWLFAVGLSSRDFFWRTPRYASTRAKKDHEYTIDSNAIGIGITVLFCE